MLPNMIHFVCNLEPNFSANSAIRFKNSMTNPKLSHEALLKKRFDVQLNTLFHKFPIRNLNFTNFLTNKMILTKIKLLVLKRCTKIKILALQMTYLRAILVRLFLKK